MSYAELRALLTDDPARAAEWVESAARRGVPEAQLRLGRMRLERGDEPDALTWFQRAARQGSAEAMNVVGRAHELGWAMEADPAAAAEWYRRAAEAGCAWGDYNLANLKFDGRGVALDLEGAVAGYRRASAMGHARAMNLLGRCLEEGWGCERDPAEAAQWYRRSAEAGYFRAQMNHASILAERGRRDEAGLWFERAATAQALSQRVSVQAIARRRWRMAAPRPATPHSISAQVAGSGTEAPVTPTNRLAPTGDRSA
jgi:TPR repeat protein